MRRGPLVVLLLVVVAAGLTAVAAWMRTRGGPRSVVLVTIDTWRHDRAGFAGRRPSPTPRLDALAAEGAVFEDVWTTAPLTVPSHATLLTGRLPPQHGLRTNEPAHRLAPADARSWATLAEILRAEGCRTAAFVSSAVLSKRATGLDAGFDVYDGPEPTAGALHFHERLGRETVDAALAWVLADDRPFFVWVHLFDPHGPYDAPAPFGAGPGNRTTPKGYDGEVAYADDCVGRLLDGLAGRADVVAVTSDHGESLGEHGEATHGFLLHEATLRVPLVIRAPGAIEPGTRIPGPNSTRDLPRTLLALSGAGLPPSHDFPGDVLVGRKPDGVAPLYAETLYGSESYGWAQAFALREGSWKVIDAGSEVRVSNLASDPSEASPIVLPAGGDAVPVGAPRPLSESLEILRGIAAESPGAVGSATDGTGAPGYLTGSGSGGRILATSENAERPSPYARIDDHALLETGAALLAGGSAEAAIVQFERLAARDPANFQAPFWRGRALLAPSIARPGDAAAAFRRAFELGMRSPRCVEIGLNASLRDGTRAELEAAVAFAEAARARGVPDTPDTAAFECTAFQGLGRIADAERALARAKAFPAPGADAARRIRAAEDALRGAPR